jgi:hypothetical protein
MPINEIEIPILKKSYDLYKLFHENRKIVSKQDRYTIWERSENTLLDMLECFLEAGYTKQINKYVLLEKGSVKLNLFRFFVRLMKDTGSLDMKKYLVLQTLVDEIGRMLGGWLRSQK